VEPGCAFSRNVGRPLYRYRIEGGKPGHAGHQPFLSLSLFQPPPALGSYVVHADPTAIPDGTVQISDRLMNYLLEVGHIGFNKGGAYYQVTLSPDMGTSRRLRASRDKPVMLPIKLAYAMVAGENQDGRRRFPTYLGLCSGGKDDGKEQETSRQNL